MGCGPWRIGAPTRILRAMCFNLTFESEDELAAIAAGMSWETDRVQDTVSVRSAPVEAAQSR